MLDHVTIRVSDLAASDRFYTTLLAPLGVGEPTRNDLGVEWDELSITPATAESPVTRGLHVGFVAASREAVDRAWQACVDAGFRSDGEPGPRDYAPTYYGGFLLDPDGNSMEPCHMETMATSGIVDHIWLRTPSVAALRPGYDAIAPHAGLAVAHEDATSVRYRGSNGFTFTFLEDPDRPLTENVHLAFASPRPGAVDAFHAVALAAGWRDNGAPGERPIYHPGYYGAFALDPDGHNIEVVDHQRG